MRLVIRPVGRTEWWSYTVGHGRLLLRRPKTATHPLRVDVLFKNVTQAQLLSHFDNLRVFELEPGDAGFEDGLGVPRQFQLVGDNGLGRVVASVVAHATDELEYDDPSSLLE